MGLGQSRVVVKAYSGIWISVFCVVWARVYGGVWVRTLGWVLDIGWGLGQGIYYLGGICFGV